MKYCISIVFFLFINAAFALITPEVDSSTILQGTPFRLTITVNDIHTHGVPDLSVLQKHFDIVGTEQNQTYTSINGHSQRSSQWTVVLIAKKAGDLTIPEIIVGNDKTTPLVIHVSSTPVANNQSLTDDDANATDGVSLIGHVDEEHPYINQEIIYTVRLYNNQRLLDVDYQAPKIDDALIISLGASRRYQTQKNNQLFTVEEQTYAIFPQRSGRLVLHGPSLNALTYDRFASPIHLPSKTSTLSVKPLPKGINNDSWLPAKAVSLTESYQKPPLLVKQGSTITRTIKLSARGLPTELLPNLVFDDQPSFRAYTQKPVLHNSIKKDDITGIKTYKVTYLFNQAGDIALPALHVKWFNTVSKRFETASLPAQHINVTATKPLPAKIEPLPTVSQKPLTKPIKQHPGNSLAWWLAGVFAAAWLVTLIFIWRSPVYFRIRREKRYALTTIQRACERNSPIEVQAALLDWARLVWPDKTILSLNDVLELIVNVSFKHEIRRLLAKLYSQQNQDVWQGADLWDAVKTFRPTKPSKRLKKEILPPLNM